MDSTGTFWLQPGESTIAGHVDALFYFIFWAAVFFFLLIVGLTVYFIIKYRRRGDEEATSHIAQNLKLEIVWTSVPIILVAIVFVWGFKIFMSMQVAPKDSIEIKVTARQWMWLFDYPNGLKSVNELVVPVNQPVKMLMSSEDVIHSFYIPQFRIKQDVLPNRYTVTWFQATRAGKYDLYCAEFCGKGHSEMRGTVRVVTDDKYQQYLEGGGQESGGGGGQSLAALGKQLYTSRACNTCHTVNGNPSVGPTWKNAFGHQVEFADGLTGTVDENYIRQSILEPKAKVVKGFQPVMPTFQGILNDRQIDGLVAYIKSLSDAGE